MARLKGNDFKFYVASALEQVTQENAREVSSVECAVRSMSINMTRATITVAERCGVSTSSGSLSVTADATLGLDAAQQDTYNLLKHAMVDGEKVFIAEVYPTLQDGFGTAGNVSILSFNQNHATDAYVQVSVSFGFEISDLLILDSTSA